MALEFSFTGVDFCNCYISFEINNKITNNGDLW